MVGYCALMEQNEALASELLDELQELSRCIFARHQGREINTTGDGFLVLFKSAHDAVECAVQVQQQLHQRNQQAPEERQILLRVGINIGDVTAHSGDPRGHAVNVAARLFPLAERGGICVSGDVARQIRDNVNVPLIKLNLAELKNIQEPMEVWRVQLPWEKPLPSRGEMNPFHHALSELTDFDSFILTHICQLVLEGNDFRFRLWSVSLWDRLRLDPSRKEDFYDSLEILHAHGYIHGEKGLRSPGIVDFDVRHYAIERYLRNSCEGYDSLFEQVVFEIVVNGMRDATKLAEKFQRPGMLIAHIFGVLENQNLLTLVRPLRGNWLITNISAKLKRSVRRK